MKTKREQKCLCGIGTLAVCCMLTGCHMSHKWQEATCTTPKTCSVGGETEGEALGHTWIDATCAEPKHCSLCGETEGEPLQADFEKYGLVCNAKVDTPITFKVPDYVTYELTETAEVTLSDYEIFQSDDKHEAVEGYEWRAVTATSISHNGVVVQSFSDYYNVATFDSYDESKDTYTVNYNGIDYTECQYDDDTIQNEWDDKVLTVKRRHFFRVPIGYDGHILYYYTYTNEGNGGYINDVADENIVIFRLE